MSDFAFVPDRFAFSSEKMRKQNLFDSERMFCDVYCFEPGQSQSAHAHAGSDKIYYVLEGDAEIEKSLVTVPPAASRARFHRSGVPIPVARS